MGFFMTCACQNNHIEPVKVLLDNKADINTCANNGASPINVAYFAII